MCRAWQEVQEEERQEEEVLRRRQVPRPAMQMPGDDIRLRHELLHSGPTLRVIQRRAGLQ
jgi:hypothetical protein